MRIRNCTQCKFPIAAIGVIMGVIGVSSHPVDAAAPDSVANELQKKCEAYRVSHFLSGTVVVRQTYATFPPSGGVSKAEEKVMHIWFNDSHIRNDLYGSDSTLISQTIVRGGVYIRNDPVGVDVVIGKASEYGSPRQYFGIPHPRWLGMGLNSLSKMDDGPEFRVLVIPEVEGFEAVVTDENISGIAAQKVSLRIDVRAPMQLPQNVPNPSGVPAGGSLVDIGKTVRVLTERDYWIVPSMGYSLLRYEARTRIPEKDISTSQLLESSFAQDHATGTWYPSHVRAVIGENEQPRIERVFDVQEATFAVPDPTVFSVEGLSLPVGRKVSDRTQGELVVRSYWDGAALVRLPNAAEAFSSVPGKHSALHRTTLTLVLGGLLSAAGILFFVVSRQGSNSH